jgi:hypothetical protein
LNVLIWTLTRRAIWASWSLEILAESTPASALSGLDILVRPLTPWAIWSRYPGIVRLCRLKVLPPLWSVNHTSSPSWSAAATTSARLSKRLAGQNRQCQHNNDHCFDSCLFHFRFLSLICLTTAFLSPFLGFFYRDSGADKNKVTPCTCFSEKIHAVTNSFLFQFRQEKYIIIVLVVG